MSYTDTVRASRVMDLQPQAVFINPEVEMEIYCCLFYTANEKLRTVVSPYPLIQYPRFTAVRKKNRIIKEINGS
jgi:alpha-D-ribose 1-methylphosphonate 5-phosphate C-P lyase